MLHIIAAFAEFERALIRERTLAGLAHAKSKGKRLGRPLVQRAESSKTFKQEYEDALDIAGTLRAIGYK